MQISRTFYKKTGNYVVLTSLYVSDATTCFSNNSLGKSEYIRANISDC